MSTCKYYPAGTAITITDRSTAAPSTIQRPRLSTMPAAAGDVVVVRVFYQWPLFVTGLGYNISNIGRHPQQAAAGRDRRLQ